MAHEKAKQILAFAETDLERATAIKDAILLGMPLAEIEEFLDQVDACRSPYDDKQDKNET